MAIHPDAPHSLRHDGACNMQVAAERPKGVSMKVLFIGGTGIISTACTELAAERGIDLTLLRRGQRAVHIPAGVKTVQADIAEEAAIEKALGHAHFDAVVDFIAFTPDQIERDIRLFGDRTRQFVFISSASAYQKPVGHYLVTESTPLANPYWQYSRDKIACEERLTRAWRDEDFPITIIRPSLTYGDTQIPLAVNSWLKSYTGVDRLRRGKKVIVPGDGTSLWVVTHNSDFAVGLIGLLGHTQAIGQTFQITSDEVLTWDQITAIVAAAAGAEAHILHIPSDVMAAAIPDELGNLTGDKANSAVFDNTKIKRFVPEFGARVRFAEGIRRTLAWFDSDPKRRAIDAEADVTWDKLIAAYEHGIDEALTAFRAP
jgi:nucleoside-diphosphate-sugar epimerase